MSSEHGARLAGHRIYLSREDVAQIEAEAVAAYRAALEAKVRALPGTGQRGVSNGHVTVWADVDRISRAAVLRLLTDGAEPQDHPEDADMNTAAGHEHWDER